MHANSYLWDLGDGRGSIVQTPLITYQQEGTYYVCLTTQDSCGTRTTCDSVAVSNTVGFYDAHSIGLSIFPNPAKNLVVIENSGHQIYAYRLLNVMGQVLMENREVHNERLDLHLAHLPRGLYLLQIGMVIYPQKEWFLKNKPSQKLKKKPVTDAATGFLNCAL